uniref:Hypothetical secreted peptide n=1 Tax=Glossina morsitans morsitans TaxID=37546 RepID=D3TSJ5_GLOMM
MLTIIIIIIIIILITVKRLNRGVINYYRIKYLLDGKGFTIHHIEKIISFQR